MQRRVSKAGSGQGPFRADKPPLVEAQIRRRAVILIVDDSPEVKGFLKDLFSQDSHTITAKNYESAVSVLGWLEVDLVISDLRMAEMDDGLKLLRWVRESRPGTKFILMSADVDDSEITEARRLGVDKVIKKPCGMEEFQRSVSDVLGASA